MFEIMFKLVMAIFLLIISLSGFTFTAAMWRKSNSLCNACRKELNK